MGGPRRADRGKTLLDRGTRGEMVRGPDTWLSDPANRGGYERKTQLELWANGQRLIETYSELAMVTVPASPKSAPTVLASRSNVSTISARVPG